MREFRFRGKSYGKWVFGNGIKHRSILSVYNVWIYIGSEYPKESNVSAILWQIVDPATIGQYTGILDKNGKEIFEGDLVRFYDDIKDELIVGEVKWHQDTCAFAVESKEREIVSLSAYWEWEVIGNIHDKEKRDKE